MKRPMFRGAAGFAAAFTLVELLVVVAIIAVLASIATPNFLEAQTRSKAARAQADMRTLATGLAAYFADANKFPPSAAVPTAFRLVPLTTPVAYLTSAPLDVFAVGADIGAGPFERRGTFAYGAMPIDQESRWALSSAGPDQDSDSELIEFYPGWSDGIWENPDSGFDFTRYDPTNGTVSDGDIWRLSDR